MEGEMEPEVLGVLGEDLAVRELWRRGKKVLYRNFAASYGGEVDVVYRDKNVLVFGEVKTRSSEYFGRPADAVNKEKQRLIVRGANAWLRGLKKDPTYIRFDVIEVLIEPGKQPQINVIADAFQMPRGYHPVPDGKRP
jgi:putative endonuclease